MRRFRRRALGFTLVELMVGMAVGLFVSLIAISVFVSTRNLNVVNSSESRMSENSRLAMDVLHEDLRSAGFQGCFDLAQANPAGNQASSVLVSAAAATAGFLDVGITGVAGNLGDGATFAPPLNPALAAAVPAPDLNSDVLVVRVPADNLSFGLTAPMANAAANPQIGASTPGNTFVTGDIALIASCQGGTIFQITDANPSATGNLAHAIAGADLPRNAAANLTRAYGGQAAVYRLQTRHYYIAPSTAASGVNSLWRLTVPPAAAPPVEIAIGIDRLKVLWGIDTTADRAVNRYVGANAVANWNQVVSARIQILAATSKDGVTQNPQLIQFDGVSSSAPDRRLRTVLTETVALRNHLP